MWDFSNGRFIDFDLTSDLLPIIPVCVGSSETNQRVRRCVGFALRLLALPLDSRSLTTKVEHERVFQLQFLLYELVGTFY